MQEFIVSNLEDENDGDFGDGNLSLREAIATAADGDNINFSENLNGGTIVLSQGELPIDKSLTIQGLGLEQLTIDANNNSRVFNLDDGTDAKIDVAIDGLKITGGNALNDSDNTFGGGIFNRENLQLSNAEVSSNTANGGAGIYNLDAIANLNTVLIAGNLISTDVLSAGTTGLGGGIASLRSTVNFDGTVTDNSGTAINVEESTLTVTNSDVVNNSGLGTGGIRSLNSTVNLENAQVRNNSASALGLAGGIASIEGSILNINNSIINENIGDAGSADDPQGRSADASGILANGTTSISNSTISGNKGIGFGLKNRGKLNVINSTFADNEGTAIVNSTNATAQIVSSTIANNTVSTSEGATAGGIINNQGEVSLLSTIVANNGAGDVPDIAREVSGSNNLIGNGENLTGLDDSNIVGTADNPIDAGLGILQNNGGNTPTIALSADSPAINAGSNPNDLATDQRGEGFERTVGNGTDIGAFELQDGSTPTTPELPDALVVSTFEDENDGDFSEGDLSLREAIALAKSGSTISFNSNLSGGTITLTSGELAIDKALTIEGLGANNLTISGNNQSRVFNVDNGNDDTANVSISGLTITQASAFSGVPGDTSGAGSPNAFGGGIVNQENLIIERSLITDNTATAGGGGIYNFGELLVSNSTLANNDDGGSSGSSGGGIVNEGKTTINNSTITGNRGFSTGGIANLASQQNLIINSSTIANNSANVPAIGGISGSGAIITSSIVADNTADVLSNRFSSDLIGDYSSGGSNLIGNLGEATGFTDKDLVNVNPLLAELQNNGGATPTIALLEDSPAIDAGSNLNNLATDQRGEGFDRTVGNGTDIGAFEVQEGSTPTTREFLNALVVSILEDENDGDFSDGDLSLREAIALANSGDTVTFADNLSGSTINLSLGELVIDKNLTIDGLGAEQLTINAGDNSRVFNIDDSNLDSVINVTLDGLAIAEGNAASDNSNGRGGAIFTSENLELTNSSLSGNSASNSGGGIYSSGDRLIVANSTISDNSARGPLPLLGTRGGGIATVGTTVEITNSSIDNNTAALNGGGGFDARDSEVTITDSSFSNNFGLGAGAINSENSNVSLSRTVVSGNRTGIFGGSGAIDSDESSVLNIDRSTIDSNSGIDPFNPSPPRGSQAFVSGIGARGTTTITNSTISNHVPERTDDPLDPDNPRSSIPQSPTGYGIRNTGDLNVINSTFAGNEDGGINNDGGTVNVSNTTVADGLDNIDLLADDNAIVTSTIVVDDTQELEAAIDANQNLTGNTDDLNLGELQNNGGATQTIALLGGSLAIDAGSNPNDLATDQRGEEFERTVGAGTDIGAFEVQEDNSQVPDIQRPDIQRPDVRVPDIEAPKPENVNNNPNSLEGTDGNDSLSGSGTNDEVISGGAGHDTLDGNGGHDNISGGAGDDLIFGGAGDDLLDGNDGHNEISGENGHDTLYGGADNDLLTGGADNDLLVGAAGHDSLLGSNGHDVINGEEGDDFLNGNDGDDLLTGGKGADTLIGGAGHDVFVLEASDAYDTIIDFELQSDRIQLSESLTLGQLSIVDNESYTGSLILDSNNHDAVIASVENVRAADLEVHIVC